ILYSRIGILILLYCVYLSYNNLFIIYLDNGVGLFGGLFYTSSITQSFHILIFIISLLILSMTGFYPRKLISNEYNIYNKISTKLYFVRKTIVSNIFLK